jgi:hypothetical protein
MNAFSGKDADGRSFLHFRLEPGNLKRLKDGDPIKKRIEDMYPDGIPRKLDLYISFSDTPVADAVGLKQMADVALDERTPVSEKKRPHCPECKSTIEQLGGWKSDAPVMLLYCIVCGCAFGAVPKA